MTVWKCMGKRVASTCTAAPGRGCAGAGGALCDGEGADLPEAGRGMGLPHCPFSMGQRCPLKPLSI